MAYAAITTRAKIEQAPPKTVEFRVCASISFTLCVMEKRSKNLRQKAHVRSPAGLTMPMRPSKRQRSFVGLGGALGSCAAGPVPRRCRIEILLSTITAVRIKRAIKTPPATSATLLSFIGVLSDKLVRVSCCVGGPTKSAHGAIPLRALRRHPTNQTSLLLHLPFRFSSFLPR